MHRMPVGVAYAQLAGFGPEIGLYSSILPLLAYALFGTSRQLIVGPDRRNLRPGRCLVAPLAAGKTTCTSRCRCRSAFSRGLLCVGASFLRLGALADFLSRPILVGFLNGIALSIALGQMGKILGFHVEAGGIVPRLLEVVGKLPLTHGPTLAVGSGQLRNSVDLRTSPPARPRAAGGDGAGGRRGQAPWAGRSAG